MIRRTFGLAALSLAAFASSANAATLNLSVSPDPTEEKLLTVTATGSTESNRTLFTYISRTQTTCPSTAYAAKSTFPSLGDSYGNSVPTGSFRKTFDYTPTDNGTYLVCGYISQNASDTPAATSNLTVSVREPTATLGMSVSADATEEKPLTVTISGTTEVNRTLFTYISRTQTTCPSTAYAAKSTFPSLGDSYGNSVASGPFTKTFDYTPTDDGPYLVCGYVSETQSDTPIATASTQITVREPTATLGMSVSADPTEEKLLTVTMNGTTEVNRTLFTYVSRNQTSCPSTAYAARSTFPSLGDSYGNSVPSGPFTKTFDYTPTDNGTYLVCGYVSETQSDTPIATASTQITVRAPAAALALATTDTGAKTIRVTANGKAEVARTLIAYVSTSASTCPATAYAARSSFSSLGDSYGERVAAGNFGKQFDYTISASGTYLICAYVSENAGDTPIATASTTVARNAALAVSAPAEVENGQAVPITLSGTTYSTLQLYAIVTPAQTGCANSAETQASRAGAATVLPRTRAEGVGISAQASFGPAPAGAYIVCAYGDGETTTLTASAQFVIKQDPAIFPIVFGQDDDQHRDRLFLRWRRATGKMKDHIMVYNQVPAAGTKPIWEGDPDDRDVRLTSNGDFLEAAIPYLGYGTFWWRIRRTDGTSVIYGPVQRARVVPRPLAAATAAARAKLTLRRSSKRPGTARIAITSSPLSKVKLVVKHHGRTLLRRSYTETVAGKRGITTKLSCARTGRTTFAVTMTDPYGTTLTRRGHWDLSSARCASLRRAEERKRQAAARRAADKRAAAERARQDANNGGGSGGSGGGGGSPGCDGDPNATPYPQHPGQRDGDGDGCYGET